MNNTLTKKIIIASFFIAYVNFSYASDLLDLYKLAQNNDPIIQAAHQEQLATAQALSIQKGLLLPQISATVSSTGNKTNTSQDYNNNGMVINLTQAIFNLPNWHNIIQAKYQAKQGNAKYAAAEQELIVRLATNYFSVQNARDNLNFATAKRKAFARQLEQTKQRFKAGLIAITDVHASQARHDIAKAEEIIATNNLANTKELLRVIVGTIPKKLAKLKTTIKLNKPKPNKIEHWVQAATAQNLNIEYARQQMAIAKQAMQSNITAHFPTLDLTASHSKTINKNPNIISSILRDSHNQTIGLKINIPIFSGGITNARAKQARFSYMAAKHQLTKQYREITSATRQAFRSVLSKISEVTALKQAVKSGQSALEATEASYNAGTRTIVDFLNAQSDLLEAKKNHANARYQYILETLKLKQAAGTLSPDDVGAVNKMLAK